MKKISKFFTFIGESFFLLIVGAVIATFLFFAFSFWDAISMLVVLFIASVLFVLLASKHKKIDSILFSVGLLILGLIMFLPIVKPFLVDVGIFYVGTLFYIYPYTYQ